MPETNKPGRLDAAIVLVIVCILVVLWSYASLDTHRVLGPPDAAIPAER